MAEIKEERMRRYFIEAAKEIIRGEGIKAVSARSVAEKAGYSYATLYNYFADMKDLIFFCVDDFLNECLKAAEEESRGASPGRERLRIKLRAFLNYFVQYPGIFELCFVESVSGIHYKAETVDRVYRYLEELGGRDWELLEASAAEGVPGQDARPLHCFYALTGMLLLFNMRHRPRDYHEFFAVAQAEIERGLRL